MPAGAAQHPADGCRRDVQPAANFAVIELLELLQDNGGTLSLGETRQGRVDPCPALLVEQALLGRSLRAARVPLESPSGGFAQVGSVRHSPAQPPAVA